MINKVILTGRITSDIELRRTNDGVPYTFFTIAVNRRQQDQTDFIQCAAWRQTAELMKNYLNKGSLIGVEGRLEVYTKQVDGKYDSRTTVQVSNITFLESRAQAQARTQETSVSADQPITFANEQTVNTGEVTPPPVSATEEANFGGGESQSIDAKDINIDDIKF